MADNKEVMSRFYAETNAGNIGVIDELIADRHISVPVADIVRFRDGRAVEHWGMTDSDAMMQQLGLAPPLPG